MALSAREVLALDVFKDAEAEVLAGSDRLDRPVRWVHVSELPDIAYLLKGGELLLTTGLGLRDDTETRIRFLQELAAVPVAGIVLELGRYFSRIPDDMVTEARRLGVPLIALHREARFVEITERVHSAIIERQYELLRRTESVGQEFTRLVLRGASLGRIVSALADIVRNPVVLEDAAHVVVEYAAYGGTSDDVLRAWESHSRGGHRATDGEGVVGIEAGDPRCAWLAVSLREAVWGRLHVLETATRLDEVGSLALDRAAAAVGLALLAEQGAAWISENARAALIADITRGTQGATGTVYRRARALGADLEGQQLAALVVEIAQHLPEEGFEGGISEQDRQRRRQELLTDVRNAATTSGCACLAAADRDRILCVLGVPGGRDIRPALEEVGREISRRVQERLDARALIGSSRASSVENLGSALESAGEANRYAARLSPGSAVVHFEELGVHQLLMPLAEGPDLARFVESEIGSLLRHDAESNTQMLPTLKAYLDAGGNKSDAARNLHVDRRTLYHRLERIDAVLQRDVDDPEVRVRLALAFHGLELLRRRSPAVVG